MIEYLIAGALMLVAKGRSEEAPATANRRARPARAFSVEPEKPATSVSPVKTWKAPRKPGVPTVPSPGSHPSPGVADWGAQRPPVRTPPKPVRPPSRGWRPLPVPTITPGTPPPPIIIGGDPGPPTWEVEDPDPDPTDPPPPPIDHYEDIIVWYDTNYH